MSGWNRAPEVRRLGLLIVALLPVSCTTQVVQPARVAQIAPQLSVERFLQAANSRDFESMGRIFGTVDGAVLETGGTFGCMFKKIGSWFGGTACDRRVDIEIWMDTIADILQHDDYRIVREDRVAGREHLTMRVLVDMTIQGRVVRGVPFEVVQAGDGRWLVQDVDLERAMGGR